MSRRRSTRPRRSCVRAGRTNLRARSPNRPSASRIARLRGVKKLFDLDLRFAEMDTLGDYRQIISLPNPPLEEIAQGDTARQLARVANDAMAELCAKHPQRFPAFVAAVSLDDVDAAL